ncbi:hypothetical protein TB1_010024 [Malus domestica]
MDKNDVMQILDGCGFYATTGIEVLLDRCLVTINKENKIMMHDLLRDMGKDIVHAENPDFPGERSRLWHPEDVNDVLIDKSGTKKIEGLALNLPSPEETSFSTKAFRNMKRLRLLQLDYVRLTGGYQCLSKKLRWLCWHGFPLEFIPIELCQPNIVVIDMQYSNLRQVLCEYSGLLDKLKILNLSHSHDLTQSPDFSKFPNLEKLILKDCKRLAKVHKSIGDLKSLVLVNLKDCETLKALPRSFYKLKSVKTLVLDGCSRFQSLSEHLGEMASLVTLYADGTAIKKVPPSIVRLEKLERLSLSKLKCSLQLPSLQGLRSLTSVNLADNNIEEVPNDIGSSLPCLVELSLDDNNFGSLPSLSGLSKLFIVSLNGCRNLVKITDLPKSLGFLQTDDCSALERMPGLDSVLNSGLSLSMMTHNNVIDFLLKDSTLHGWTGGGIITLAGRQIPTWFNHVNEGTQVSFEVPKEIGCNATALAVCLAAVPRDYISSCYIYVINHTKGTSFCVELGDVLLIEEMIWLANLSLSETEFNLEESDLVHVIAHCPVKKIGVRLVCDKLMTFKGSLFDYHYIPYERALEEISTEVDDFDEDFEDDDFDEVDDNTMRFMMGMMRRILMGRMRNKTMIRTKKLRMIMMRVMMGTKTTTTM